MSDIRTQAYEKTQDALMESYLLLFKASNRTTEKKELEKLKKERARINRELDRLEMAELNSMVLPEQIQQAIGELEALTKELSDEKKRIEKTTATLKKVDYYLNQAGRALGFGRKMFA